MAGLLILLFGFVSVWATPFVYDDANSGRYLLKVIKAADPQLFVNDPVTVALQEFDSAFYNVLALTFSIAPAGPQSVEPVMFALYILSKIMLFAVLYWLARTFTAELGFFILLAAWAIYPQGIPVGGVALFSPAITHSEVAFLLCLVALSCFLAGRRYILFWACMALALLVHALVALHFLLVVFPVYLIWHRPTRQDYLPHVAGGLLFAASLFYYFLFMAPANLSPAEGRLFLQLKGTMNHISPFDQSPVGWLTLLAVMGIAFALYWQFARGDNRSRQLVILMFWGSVLGFALSLIAITLPSVRLSLFQPMRIYYWVWVAANLLLLWQIYRQLRARSPLGIILLAAVCIFLLESLYAFVFLGMALAYMLVEPYLCRSRPQLHRHLPRWVSASLMAMIAFILIGWLAARFLGLDAYFLNSLWPVPLLVLLALISSPLVSVPAARSLLWLSLAVVMILGASSYWYGQLAHKTDPDWQRVKRWIRVNTAKTDQFITTPDLGGNFRTGSFRTSLTESMSALAWVDPVLAVQNADDVRLLWDNYSEGQWNLAGLSELAWRKGAAYVVIRGPFEPSIQPVFSAGEISVIRIDE